MSDVRLIAVDPENPPVMEFSNLPADVRKEILFRLEVNGFTIQQNGHQWVVKKAGQVVWHDESESDAVIAAQKLWFQKLRGEEENVVLLEAMLAYFQRDMDAVTKALTFDPEVFMRHIYNLHKLLYERIVEDTQTRWEQLNELNSANVFEQRWDGE